MIEIYWINEGNFKLDFTNDKKINGQAKEVTEQLYALVMGWS